MQTLQCPGTTSTSCGSICAGEVEITRTATCDSSGKLTSCFIRANTGESCNCLGGACSLGIDSCPCKNPCGEECLDGRTRSEVTCCGGVVYEGQVTCCVGFACDDGLDCCPNGVKKCIEPGGSCCEDGAYGCPAGETCIDKACCPRVSSEGQPFTSFDPSKELCCGTSSCVASGQCSAATGSCACAVRCDASCCPEGTVCCGHKGWCAPSPEACPRCPMNAPQACSDGTCVPAGATCCGGGTYCTSGLKCLACGDGKTCCSAGGGVAAGPASVATMPLVPDGGGAVASVPSAASSGPADEAPSAGLTPAPLGCGGRYSGRPPSLGTGCACGAGGGELFVLVLLALGRRRLRGGGAR